MSTTKTLKLRLPVHGFFYGRRERRHGVVNAYLDADRVHKGRRPGVRVIQVNLDEESLDILREYCPEGSKQLGTFISRLLIDRRARDEERRRMREEVMAVVS
jgi:hypothetical protein